MEHSKATVAATTEQSTHLPSFMVVINMKFVRWLMAEHAGPACYRQQNLVGIFTQSIVFLPALWGSSLKPMLMTASCNFLFMLGNIQFLRCCICRCTFRISCQPFLLTCFDFRTAVIF